MDEAEDPSLQVLVVEPERELRTLLIEVLAPLGHVVAVSTMAEAEARMERFDVAIVNGDRYRDAGAQLHVPLVVLTSVPDSVVEDSILDLRHSRVMKPFSPHVLLDVVRRATNYLACVA
jgi:DNA-binding response OmpR family regulator